MSNKVIPKEQLSAYQRWELTALEEGKAERRTTASEGVESVVLPTAEEMEQMQQRAHQEGFAAGYQEGRLRGQADAQHMKQLLNGVAQALEQLDQQVAQDVLALSLDVAKQMLRQAIKVKPGLVMAVVREAINSLPQASHHPHLILHPEDAALVKSFMEAELAQSSWRIQEDSRIERGGCRIESANSEIDATLETRWKRIVAALGADDAWLE